MSRTIEVVDCDPNWPLSFTAVRDSVAAVLDDVVIEHVGSTSVPGLAAKPVIDIDVIVADASRVPPAIERLASIGYAHRGDLGVPGREAFVAPIDRPRHNLYLVPSGSLALRNHLAVRDALRADATLAHKYGELKRDLAARHPDDIDAYVAGKSVFIAAILAGARFDADELAAIDAINRPR